MSIEIEGKFLTIDNDEQLRQYLDEYATHFASRPASIAVSQRYYYELEVQMTPPEVTQMLKELESIGLPPRKPQLYLDGSLIVCNLLIEKFGSAEQDKETKLH